MKGISSLASREEEGARRVGGLSRYSGTVDASGGDQPSLSIHLNTGSSFPLHQKTANRITPNNHPKKARSRLSVDFIASAPSAVWRHRCS